MPHKLPGVQIYQFTHTLKPALPDRPRMVIFVSTEQ